MQQTRKKNIKRSNAANADIKRIQFFYSLSRVIYKYGEVKNGFTAYIS